MLYLIDNEYYMLRNREYVKVDIDLKNGELSIKPNRQYVVEANNDVKARGVLIEDIIKSLKNKKANDDLSENALGDTRRKKYDM